MAAKIQKKMKKTAFGCEKYRVIAYFRARAALFHVIPCGSKTLFARRVPACSLFCQFLVELEQFCHTLALPIIKKEEHLGG